jgi:electron transfer flavoprotein alpha subunit
MRIVVCIKQVPVISAMEFDAATRTLKREGVPSEVSAFDVRAVIRAVELAQQHGGEVVILTMGPPQARAALEDCLALGADRGVHLCDRAFAGADTLATAEALAAALRHEPFDLILCGRNSTDAETGQVGPEIAELLDLPQVTGARTLAFDLTARTLTAERETDAGFETVVAPLPALVTAAEDLAPERFPSKAERAAAKEKPIDERSAQQIGADRDRIGAAGSPTWVAGLETTVQQREGRILEAPTPEATADELVAALLSYGLFSTSPDAGSNAEGARSEIARHLYSVPVNEVARDLGARAVRDTRESRDILVAAEVLGGALRPVSLELLGKATELAGRVGGAVTALLIGDGVRQHVPTLAAHGATRVFLADDPAWHDATTESYATVLERVIREHAPGMVLLPSTALGRDVAPRVAARLRLGLTGDCIDLSLDGDGRLVQHKPAFGGSVVAPILSRTRPEMATVRPGMLAAGGGDGARQAEIVSLSADGVGSRVRVVEARRAAEQATELDHAEVVVGVGMGIGGPENLAIIRELVDVIGGTLCTTRNVTDAGWLPKQYQVGLTGRAIAPKLFIAVAIRGAFEHVVGIRRAGRIVAINTKAKAPIFKHADLGIVGDYAVYVPLLIERLRAARERAQ